MQHVSYIATCLIFVKVVHSQGNIGDSCIFKSSGSSGVCKLLTKCQQVRDEVVTHHVLPQTCGFQGTQAIVCCPKHRKRPRKPGEISLEKCRQYSSYAYDENSFTESAQITKNECGHMIVKRIVGGIVASRKEFPHMAILGFEPEPGNVRWFCGGTLISEQYVLTAGQCLSHSMEYGDAKYVRIGVANLNDKNHRQELKIVERIPHPQYKSTSHYHDIGLAKLETPAEMNPYARPACLYIKPDITAEKAIATGWGRTEWGGSSSDDLLKVTLNLFDHAFCNSSYKKHISRKLRYGIIDDIQVCAGSKTEEKDTCQGDSGGPLQLYHEEDTIKCMHDIVGVTSFGKDCSGSQGIYSRVSYYIKWIEDIVWPETS